MSDLLAGQFGRGTALHAPQSGRLHAFAGSLDDKAAFKFGERGENVKGEFAAWDRGVDFFGERTEVNDALVEVLNDGNEVAQAAGQPVELPNGERVAVPQCFEATGEGRALRGGSGAAVGENLFASGALQRLQLHVGVLVNGRYAGVAVFHPTRSNQAARAFSSLGMQRGPRAPQATHSTCVAWMPGLRKNANGAFRRRGRAGAWRWAFSYR